MGNPIFSSWYLLSNAYQSKPGNQTGSPKCSMPKATPPTHLCYEPTSENPGSTHQKIPVQLLIYTKTNNHCNPNTRIPCTDRGDLLQGIGMQPLICFDIYLYLYFISFLDFSFFILILLRVFSSLWDIDNILNFGGTLFHMKSLKEKYYQLDGNLRSMFPLCLLHMFLVLLRGDKTFHYCARLERQRCRG
jgi:hypothetical protein